MPIEREFKFVLLHDTDLEAKLLGLDAELGSDLSVTHIDQGYLGKGGRVRRKTPHVVGDAAADVLVSHVFTYKHTLANQPGVLEIECLISQDDFDLAWEDSTHRLRKTRYAVRGDEGVWEIDFFRHEDTTYFAMAELEVPADSGPPSTLHPLVEEYLLFAVPEADDRFKNRNISCRDKVADLLQEIASNGSANAQ